MNAWELESLAAAPDAAGLPPQWTPALSELRLVPCSLCFSASGLRQGRLREARSHSHVFTQRFQFEALFWGEGQTGVLYLSFMLAQQVEAKVCTHSREGICQLLLDFASQIETLQVMPPILST